LASKNLSSLLLYPLENGAIERLETGKTLLWGAQYDNNFSELTDLTVIQNFKPYANLWEQSGINVEKTPPTHQKFQNIYCVLPKQKEAAQYQLAFSANILTNHGLLMAVAENEAGGKRLKKWVEELGFKTTSLSKNKCRIVWGFKEDINQEKTQNWITQGDEKQIIVDGLNFLTKAGIYGWKKIDSGSKLLLKFIPDNLTGVGADFGCGYGFLSQITLGKNDNIQKLYAIDADFDALICAEKNLSKSNVEFFWEDLIIKPNNLPPLDWIVMNPPFHEGKSVDSDIGQKFIQTAAQSLKKKGVLYMVANVFLPYEKILNDAFFSVDKLAEQDGFKIYKAEK
jgi:16S rRNA (guanine1207-N2)-methyltransferase